MILTATERDFYLSKIQETFEVVKPGGSRHDRLNELCQDFDLCKYFETIPHLYGDLYKSVIVKKCSVKNNNCNLRIVNSSKEVDQMLYYTQKYMFVSFLINSTNWK